MNKILIVFGIVLMLFAIFFFTVFSKRNAAVYEFRINILNECKTADDLNRYLRLPSYNQMFWKFWKPLESYLLSEEWEIGEEKSEI